MISAGRRHLALQALPAVWIALVTGTDLLLGSNVSVLGQAVVAPLLATVVCSPALTLMYGLAALSAGALLGIVDGLYSDDAKGGAQAIRLASMAVITVVAVLLSKERLRREQRLSQVTKVAEAAQRAILLPVPDQLGPASVAVHYESAASDALVGGDLYGMVVTPFGLRVLVGDVRGKGLGAVRMSAQVLATFRERASDDPALGVLLDHMDRTVQRCAEDTEDFVTAVLAQLDNDGVLSLTAAGHPFPFVLTQGRVRPVRLDPPRPPLGLGGRPPITVLHLMPGDRALLYTDGLTEARNPDTGAFLPSQAIIAALAANMTVPEAVEALRHDALAWSGGRLHDDLALVLIEYVAPGQPPAPPGSPRPETREEGGVAGTTDAASAVERSAAGTAPSGSERSVPAA